MADFNDLGRILIYIGILITAVGGLIYFVGGNFSWLGHLPGDIRIEKENFSFYFPITSMILISLILNVIIKIVQYFLK